MMDSSYTEYVDDLLKRNGFKVKDIAVYSKTNSLILDMKSIDSSTQGYHLWYNVDNNLYETDLNLDDKLMCVLNHMDIDSYVYGADISKFKKQVQENAESLIKWFGFVSIKKGSGVYRPINPTSIFNIVLFPTTELNAMKQEYVFKLMVSQKEYVEYYLKHDDFNNECRMLNKLVDILNYYYC